jgi:hypothetical protein
VDVADIFVSYTSSDRECGAFGVNIGHLWDQPRHDPQLDKPDSSMAVVDRSFAFAAAAAAHCHIEGRGNIGKVVLLP